MAHELDVPDVVLGVVLVVLLGVGVPVVVAGSVLLPLPTTEVVLAFVAGVLLVESDAAGAGGGSIFMPLISV